MFEVWADKAEPAVRLVVRQGGALPVELGSRDWLRLGPIEASDVMIGEVATKGFCFFRSEEPLPDPSQTKDANAAGA